jgi:hypothetical protein
MALLSLRHCGSSPHLQAFDALDLLDLVLPEPQLPERGQPLQPLHLPDAVRAQIQHLEARQALEA